MLAAIDQLLNRLLDPPLGAILLGGLAGVVNFAVIGFFRVRAREIGLKDKMVERGFSASEIERVMKATSSKSSRKQNDDRGGLSAQANATL